MIKKQTFIQGVTIIALSRLIVKVIGAIYKIPLDTFVLGPEGMGYYNASYTIYNWLIVISTVGLPVAVSKLVSEQTAVDNHATAMRIFKVSRKLLLIVGLVGCGLLFLGADLFSTLISAPSAKLSIMALAPSLIFVSVNSAYRGFYQGVQNMTPTAGSEVVEALFKLFCGLSLAYFFKTLFEGSLKHGAMGGILGVTISTVVSFIFLYLYHKRHVRKLPTTDQDRSIRLSNKGILRRLIVIAVPITLGASAFNLTALVDTSMVMFQLKGLGYIEAQRSTMYGYLTRAITLFNMPLTVVAAIAIAIVPAIALAIAQKDRKLAHASVRVALRLSIFIALPCAVGLSVLAKPIFQLIYNDTEYYGLLTVMAIAVIFATLVQVTGSILQAYGKVWYPVIHLLVGGAAKIIINILLVSNPEINIYGAPWGTLACHVIIMSLNLWQIRRVSKIRLAPLDFIFKPALLAATVGLVAYFSYSWCFALLKSNSLSVLIAMGLTAVVYALGLVVTRSIKRDDLKFMPKGEKLEKILGKYLS